MDDTTNLAQALGRVEGSLGALQDMLEAHTLADNTNFKELKEMIIDKDKRLDEVELPLAVANRMKRWTLGAVALAISLFELARYIGGMP